MCLLQQFPAVHFGDSLQFVVEGGESPEQLRSVDLSVSDLLTALSSGTFYKDSKINSICF